MGVLKLFWGEGKRKGRVITQTVIPAVALKAVLQLIVKHTHTPTPLVSTSKTAQHRSLVPFGAVFCLRCYI